MALPAVLLFLAPAIPKLVSIFKAVPKNQHGQIARGISMYYKRFGLQKTKDLIMQAGSVASIIVALRKVLKDDY